MSNREIEKGKGYVPQWFVKHPSTKVNKWFKFGGIPSGSIIQIQSDGEATYKTTVAVQLMVNAQQQGLEVAYVDAENALIWEETGEVDENGNPIERCMWLEDIGLDTTNMYYVPGGFQEQLYEDIKHLIKNKGVDFIVLDAIPSLEPEKVHENEAGDNIVGLRAKINTTELNKLTGLCRQYHAVLCGINHKKDVITNQGSRGKSAVGGRGWGFYSHLIMIHKRSKSKSQLEGKDLIDVSIYIEKNKLGKAFKEIKEVVEQGKGIVPEYGILETLLSEGLISKKASWFRWKPDDEPIAQGTEQAIEWIKENKSLIEKHLGNE